MIFLSKIEIEEGVAALFNVIDTIIDSENADVISSHMNNLSSIGASASLLYASAKYYYLKDKKNAEASSMYTYTESLLKSLHYKISSCQSMLRRESQVQFNNKSI